MPHASIPGDVTDAEALTVELRCRIGGGAVSILATGTEAPERQCPGWPKQHLGTGLLAAAGVLWRKEKQRGKAWRRTRSTTFNAMSTS